ncbi:zinc ribbon domain-containing protein [Bacillus sp. Bva_UNVM-123]|uniref:zinc ribbon domain-containing protein n=1 Tax=Bacillus sp. Bva_UNVM-123 TaxID=2829798 RepID=UPI00391F51E0
MGNSLSKKCRCKHCGKNMKFKKERLVHKYICSSYDNYGKCKRITIEEDFLKGLIQRRYQKEMTDQEIREVVDYIEIEDKLLLEIHFKDKTEPILCKGTFIQF